MNDWGEPAKLARARRRDCRLTAIVAVLFVLAFTNLFLRTSLGVMAPELAREMALGPAELSIVASSFFFAYALMQVPTGMLLDRFGARATLAGMLLFTTVGVVIFAAARSFEMLALGRVLMGIGCAGIFTGAFYVLALWLPQQRVVPQMGTLNSFAASGSLCSTAPLAALIALFGWRQCYWMFAVGVGVLLVAIWIIVRDGPPGGAPQAARSEPVGAVLGGVVEAIRQPGMWRLLMAGLPISASTTVAGVWGAPYLRDVHGLDTIGSGHVLLGIALSAMAGHTLHGLLARQANSVKTSIVTGATLVIASMGTLALVERPPVLVVAGLFCVMACAASYPIIVFAHARGLVAARLMGRGLSAANMGVMLAIASMQLVFGGIVGAIAGGSEVLPEVAYRAGFGAQAGVALLALLIYLPIKDVRPAG